MTDDARDRRDEGLGHLPEPGFGLLEEPEAIEVPVAAVEHYSYCPRQCGLMYVEQVFEENEFTVRGSGLHERVHSGLETVEEGVHVVRALPLHSRQWGLRGVADLVELRAEGPYPVEFKSGKRVGLHADLQLCAQALCLEEMLGLPVPVGAIYYHATRARYQVALDEALRQRTIDTIGRVRAVLEASLLPPAVNDNRCPNCSLVGVCLPDVAANPARLRGLQSMLFRVWDSDEAERAILG